MGYSYGLKQCRKTLLELSSELPFKERIVKAYAELGQIDARHVSPAHYTQVQQWAHKYLSMSEFTVSEKGVLTSVREKALRELSKALVGICVEIIQYNSPLCSKI